MRAMVSAHVRLNDLENRVFYSTEVGQSEPKVVLLLTLDCPPIAVLLLQGLF